LKDDTKLGIAWFYLFNNEKTQNMTNETMPIWIKQVAGQWSSGNVQDEYFYSAIDYLMKHNIISSNDEKIDISTVPHWLQKSAHLWFTGEIDDNTFVNSIQYMISSGIIH